MTHALALLLALLIGVVAGLRAFAAPAAVAWAAMLDWVVLDGTWAHWVGHPITVGVFTVLAVGELVTDHVTLLDRRDTARLSAEARALVGEWVQAGWLHIVEGEADEP